jgi:hypothetical protein
LSFRTALADSQCDTPVVDADHEPRHGHGPSDPIRLRVAFLTERHAARASATIAQRPELATSARVSACGLPNCDLVLVDITTRHRDRPQVRTLVHGLHGVVVASGDRAVAACFPKREEPVPVD